MESICADLRAEHEALDAVVAGLDEEGWDTATPAEGWAVRDQIAHLAFFDDKARLAATDPHAFASDLEAVMTDGTAYMNRAVERGRALGSAELLTWWRSGREALLADAAELDPSTRVAWYGPPMGALSFITARLMETWAHGQDVIDGLGVTRSSTDRLRHICHIGVRTLPFSFGAHGQEVPTAAVRVELVSPSGDVWEWGPHDASDIVRGEALDFALLVTQRRHRDDVELVAVGDTADRWLSLAQCFAGPPGSGRRSGQFPRLGRPGRATPTNALDTQ
jgi:uncharacterized protein (TIGR03084 family)